LPFSHRTLSLSLSLSSACMLTLIISISASLPSSHGQDEQQNHFPPVDDDKLMRTMSISAEPILGQQKSQVDYQTPQQLSNAFKLVTLDRNNITQPLRQQFSTYTSPELGISLKYPSNWSKTEDIIRKKVTFNATSNSSEGTHNPLYNQSLQISSSPSHNLTLDQWLNKTMYEYMQDSPSLTTTLDTITSFGFNGYSDRTLHLRITGDLYRQVKDIYFISDAKLYNIRYNCTCFLSDDSLRRTFPSVVKSMLDSIKLINTSTSNFTSQQTIKHMN